MFVSSLCVSSKVFEYGMRMMTVSDCPGADCLFYLIASQEVTKIEDAVLLYEKLKKKAETQMFKADQDVECEDSEGNVMSAKTFEDLRRQGLL